MSFAKSDGAKIEIRFSEDLVGDVSGNQSSFLLSGHEYEYVPDGRLAIKPYAIESVDRVAVPVLYEDDFSGNMVGVEKLFGAVILERTENDIVETNIWDGTYVTKFLSRRFWQPESGGTRTTTRVPVVAGATYNFLGGNRCRLLWVASNDTTVSFEDCPNDTPITRVAPNSTGVYYYYTTAAHDNALITTLITAPVYSESGEYMVSPISSTTLGENFRLKCKINMPMETSVITEYAVVASNSTPPTAWTSVDDGDIIDYSQEGYFWIRVTLKTTNTYATPAIERIWLEPASAPQNTLLIRTGSSSRFNSAVGNLTITYDATTGNLAGIGGPVESFEVSFTPTDLVAKPHQNRAEHIELSDISAVSNLIRIYYTDAKCDERVSISNITAIGVLTHINDI